MQRTWVSVLLVKVLVSRGTAKVSFFVKMESGLQTLGLEGIAPRGAHWPVCHCVSVDQAQAKLRGQQMLPVKAELGWGCAIHTSCICCGSWTPNRFQVESGVPKQSSLPPTPTPISGPFYEVVG